MQMNRTAALDPRRDTSHDRHLGIDACLLLKQQRRALALLLTTNAANRGATRAANPNGGDKIEADRRSRMRHRS